MTVFESARMADWKERSQGKVPYTPDIALPNLCYARIVRSPHPRAWIRRIDAASALAMPGVVAVVTAQDFPGIQYVHRGGPQADCYPLARDGVRYVGEEVAAVAADSAEQARRAVAAVRVSYRIGRSVLSPRAALRAWAPHIHQRSLGTNVSARINRVYGHLPESQERGLIARHGVYCFGQQSQVPMETAGTVAFWDERAQKMHLWTSTQAPYFIRKEVAHVLDLDMAQIESHEVAVGGGFGGKSKVGQHEALAAKLSMMTGRPVQLILSREEEFATTKPRHPFEIDLTTRFSPDGDIVDVDGTMIVDNGAYNHTGPTVMASGVNSLVSQYPTMRARVDARLVDTTKPPGGSFRGYGSPQAIFAIESQVDEFARDQGIDPIELRARNLFKVGDVTHSGWRIESSEMAACLETLRTKFDWDRRRANRVPGRGLGMAVAVHVSGINSYPDADRSGARVEIGRDGAIDVYFGGADPGTGLRGVLARAVASELDVPVERVVPHTMDSSVVPSDLGSWSSRGTVMAAGAAQTAGLLAAQELKRRAAAKFGVSEADVRLAGGRVLAGQDQVEFGDLVVLEGDDVLSVTGEFLAQAEKVNPETGVADISTGYSFAAHAAEVEVDEKTGQVTVLDYLAVHDAGHVMNLAAARGQIAGGVAMGIGAALSEEIHYEGGRMVNPTLLHYAMPRAADLPRIAVEFVPARATRSPYGVKSVGEIALTPVAPTIANAVADATGRRLRSLPLTPDKVLAAPVRGPWERTMRYQLWKRPSRWWISLLRASYPWGVHFALHGLGRLRPRLRMTEPADRLARPTDVDEARSLLESTTTNAVLVGGGTDLLPDWHRARRSRQTTLVDTTCLTSLRKLSLSHDSETWFIGGAVTLQELQGWAQERRVDAVADALALIATPQIRAIATVAGNLCQEKRCWFYRNGFDCYKRSGPSHPCYAVTGPNTFQHAIVGAHRCQAVTPSDLATVFTALDARARVVGPSGERSLDMDALYRGPGETALARGDVLTGVEIDARWLTTRTGYTKLALWKGDFAISTAAVNVQVSDDRVTDARVVLGGVAEKPWRVSCVEEQLVGTPLPRVDIDHLAACWVRQAHPLRGNQWKVDATVGVLDQALHRALDRDDMVVSTTEPG